MATQLKLYQGALRHIGERKLSSITENREPRRALDDVWSGGALNYVLEQGQWNFATRAIQIAADASVTPGLGYAHAFTKPTDLVRMIAICSDEYFTSPIIGYADEPGFLYSDCDPIYLKYVSNDSQYGGDLSIWPETFTKWVECWLATQICERISQNNSKWEMLLKLDKKLLTDARSKDAMAGPTQFLPRGSWAGARGGGRFKRYDRA